MREAAQAGRGLSRITHHASPPPSHFNPISLDLVVERLATDAEAAGRFLGLRVPAARQGRAAHLLVAGVAVGYRNEFHGSSGLGELGGGSAELAVTIVRVSAERDHAERGAHDVAGGADV